MAKIKSTKHKERYTKHIHTIKDWVTPIPIKTRGELEDYPFGIFKLFTGKRTYQTWIPVSNHIEDLFIKSYCVCNKERHINTWRKKDRQIYDERQTDKYMTKERQTNTCRKKDRQIHGERKTDKYMWHCRTTRNQLTIIYKHIKIWCRFLITPLVYSNSSLANGHIKLGFRYPTTSKIN
jgi:hypothetical protein